jgi:hypothetical protein
MGIKKGRLTTRQIPREVREFQWRGETLRFWTPGTAEIIPSQAQLNRAKSLAPHLHNDLTQTALVMALCYVAAPEDGEIDPLAEILGIANDDVVAFVELMTTFNEIFSDCLSLGTAKEAAKNDSVE